MGSYTLDSHNCQRYVTPEGFVQNEGDVGVHTKGPYRISYGSLVPKRDQCENLLVPVCLSATHIAYGSIRMEPVFMILGQSAATAALLAIDRGTATGLVGAYEYVYGLSEIAADATGQGFREGPCRIRRHGPHDGRHGRRFRHRTDLRPVHLQHPVAVWPGSPVLRSCGDVFLHAAGGQQGPV